MSPGRRIPLPVGYYHRQLLECHGQGETIYPLSSDGDRWRTENMKKRLSLPTQRPATIFESTNRCAKMFVV